MKLFLILDSPNFLRKNSKSYNYEVNGEQF